jgi:hypothetical protein
MPTLDSDTNSLAALLFALGGGKFRVRLEDPNARPGSRRGAVLNDTGESIGEAADGTYDGAGFAVHTKPFAGYVALEQIEFVS